MSIWICHCGAPLVVSCSSEHEHSTCLVHQPLPRFIEQAQAIALEMACSELDLCADALDACSHAAEVLRDRPCGCGSAAQSVRAVIARWRELRTQVRAADRMRHHDRYSANRRS